MLRFTSLPRPVLLIAALLFAGATVGYSAVWMYCVRKLPEARVPFAAEYSLSDHVLKITWVEPNSWAERAGLRPGDTILEVNGRPVIYPDYFETVMDRGQRGEPVEFLVSPQDVATPYRVSGKLLPVQFSPQSLPERAARELVASFPVVFLVVCIPVLFLRLQDSNAWLLALVFAGLIAGAPLTPFEEVMPTGLRRFALWYAFTASGLLPAIFYYFFAVFPARSPIDRRAPWLKRILVAVACLVAIPVGIWVSVAASSYPLRDWFFQFAGDWDTPIIIGSFLTSFGLGLTSLLLNSFRSPSRDAARKSRVIVWGMVAGLTPFALLLSYSALTNRAYYDLPYWIWTPGVIAVFLVPLSFAYAVVKHRVLEIPVLLKRTARYALVRGGFTAVMLFLSIWLPFRLANIAEQNFQLQAGTATPLVMLVGVSFGIIWAISATQVERLVAPRIDRAFFRSVYDARQILQDLAEKVRNVASRVDLASLLHQHIHEALHPRSVAVYFEEPEGLLRCQGSAGALLESLSPESPLLKELASHGRPWEVPSADAWLPAGSYAVVDLPQLASLRALLDQEMARSLPPAASGDVLAALAPVAPECLVPLVGREGRLLGLLVLGQRMSEEPYSDEDERLLGSVASQAAIALENMRLAETMAQKLEAERKAASEIAIAREVQSKLFPQTHPPLATLEYAGLCDQARKVGGDYYDFLDLGAGRVGLVLADISGKGIFAALLMANLQANLRSQYARALDDLRGLMRSVNHLFRQSTATGLYATMFFADYCDATRALRFVNCGHNPPLLLRADGSHQRLEPTAPVIGLLEDWDCEVGEVSIAPGDQLVVYSDGVTEAQSNDGEFFGEKRLLEAARASGHLTAAEAARAVAQTVHTFSGSEQEDDLTLLVARAR